MPPPKRVTLKDVAKAADISLAAVSMALRNHPSLPEKTIARVKRIAATLGYVPDPALCALAAHRSRLSSPKGYSVIGLVSNWEARDAWSCHPSARQVIAGASERAQSLGYSVQHFWAREDGASPARFNAILKARGIRGLILAPFAKPDDTIDLEWENFAVVTLERSPHYPLFHHVVPNHYADLMLCWDHLRLRGYTRIGLVVRKDLAVRWTHQWEAAHSYAQTLVTARIDRIPTLELEGGDRVAQIRAWLRKYRPEAVINRSEEFHAAIREEGLRIPDDLGYVGLNVVDDLLPNASGIVQPRTTMGATAVDMLNNLLLHNQRGFQPVALGTQIDGQWRDGDTLRTISAPA